MITWLTLEMDRARAQEIDLANAIMQLPSCPSALILSKSDGEDSVYINFSVTLLGLQITIIFIFSLTISESVCEDSWLKATRLAVDY